MIGCRYCSSRTVIALALPCRLPYRDTLDSSGPILDAG